MSVVAIIQARMSSARLPGKVMAEIAGRPAIGHTIARAKEAAGIDALWLACSRSSADDPLADYARGQAIALYRGDEDDVLSRYAEVADETGAEAIVRLTGDCPMLDPEVIDLAIERFRDTVH